jgi:hypothetical protein
MERTGRSVSDAMGAATRGRVSVSAVTAGICTSYVGTYHL